MTQPRAVINVVGAKASPHQLLKQISFFVAALGAAETRQGIPAVRVANFCERVAGVVERLFPGRFTEYLAPVIGIEFEVCRLGDAGFANQRLG